MRPTRLRLLLQMLISHPLTWMRLQEWSWPPSAAPEVTNNNLNDENEENVDDDMYDIIAQDEADAHTIDNFNPNSANVILSEEDIDRNQQNERNDERDLFNNEENDDESQTGEDVTTNFGRRYPKQNRKQKRPQEIDFQNRAYSIMDGIIHLNPSVFDYDEPRGPPEEQMELSAKEVNEHILGVTFVNQYGIKKGIKLFGEKG